MISTLLLLVTVIATLLSASNMVYILFLIQWTMFLPRKVDTLHLYSFSLFEVMILTLSLLENVIFILLLFENFIRFVLPQIVVKWKILCTKKGGISWIFSLLLLVVMIFTLMLLKLQSNGRFAHYSWVIPSIFTLIASWL